MNNISVPKLRQLPFRLFPIMGLALASTAFGQIPAASKLQAPALSITDGVNTVVIDGSATVYMSVGCSCSSASAPTVVAGQITWSGTVGAYTLSSLQGSSRPVLVAPSLDLGIPGGLTSNASSGPLTISWTDINFTGMAPAAIVTTGNFIVGSGSAAYSVYVDSSNVPFGAATPVSSASTTTGAAITASTLAIPSGMFSMTQTEVLTLSAGGFFANDFGYNLTPAVNVTIPPVTTVSLIKTASAKSVSPFQKVTYTYVAKNTGNVTLTKLTITDDNATPGYTGDDFTVCTIASLAPGASQTCTASIYPPVTEGANDTSSWGGDWGNGNGWGGWGFNYNNIHPGGTLICKSKPNGNVEFTYLVNKSVTDNTYGAGSSNWGWGGGSFSNLSGNAGAEFQVLDGRGNTVLDFAADYVSASSNYPSGYGTCGIKGNGGCLYSGNSKNIVSIDTTITDNLNRSKAFNKCTQNSPTGNPDWQSQCGYKIEVNCAAWGSNGFGGINCPIVKHTAKNSNCSEHQIKPISSTATNTATLTGYYGTTELVPVKATATVTINASQQGGTSDCWGQNSNNQYGNQRGW